MAGSYNQTNARCPYYIYEDPKKKIIACQGIIPETFAKQVFKRRKEYTAQIQIFCDKDYRKCEHCMALDRYWDYD